MADPVLAEPRLSVAHGLRRLVQSGAWPAEQLTTFQNLLLDECGGDTRPLVVLLLRAVEQGIPEALADTGPGEWDTHRAQLVHRMMANAFVQPDMARWVVSAWGFALGLTPEPWVAAPPATEANGSAPLSADPNRHWAPAAPAPVLAGAAGAARRPLFAPRTSSWAPSTTPLSPQDRRRDRLMFGGIVGILLLLAIPAMYLARKRAPQMAADVAAYAAQMRSARPSGALLRAAGAFSGQYRVERTLETVHGSPSCSDGSAAAHWPLPTMETIAHDSLTGTFQFLSRPEVRGRVSRYGDMEAGPIYGRKDGVEYAFSMVGRFTPDGFEARAQTTTRTVISWLTVERCTLTGRLSARRVQ